MQKYEEISTIFTIILIKFNKVVILISTLIIFLVGLGINKKCTNKSQQININLNITNDKNK